MSQNPIASGSSVPGGAGSRSAFPSKPVAFDGPETVINPERRSSPGSDSDSAPRTGNSSIWSRLFPQETAQTGGSAVGPVGCRLGHFLIEAMIGSGGMGAVFRAVDERLDRVVALKVLSPGLTRDAASVQRFVNEARAAARLDHENIARVFYVGEDQGLNFIAHEFVTGRNVRDLIREYGPFDPREAVNYTLQLATALRHTSAAGVVHRDIKPSNVIVTPRGRAKLVDLGLAKKVASESFGDLTIAGTTLGTFDYISPEQAKDPRNVDVRSDIYSLGCTLYHMLAGEPPYPEGTVLQKLLDHQSKGVPDPARKNPRTPPQLSAVVRRMMAPEPRDRYSTPDELILDLLPIAAAMGLRGINPEGLVWTSQPIGQRSFLDRNLSWIVALAALFVIAFLFDRFAEKTHESGSSLTQLEPQTRVTPFDSATASRPSEASPSPPGPPLPSSTAPKNDLSSGPRPPGRSEAATPSNKITEGSSSKSFLTPIIPTNPEKVFSDPLPSLTGEAPSTSGPGSSTMTNSGASPNGTTSSPAVQTLDPKIPLPNPADPLVETPQEKPLVAQPPEFPPISITEGGETKAYPTVEAAVAVAKDESRIELKFNGTLGGSEKPIHVSGKRVTISGAKGYRPSISFSPIELPATGYESRMITLNNGGIELVNVDIQAVVPESLASDHWSLFSLGGPDRLRLRGVNITVTNPGNRQAEVIDVSSTQLAGISSRQTGPMGAPQEFELAIERSFVRGNCGLFAIRTTEGGRLEFQQSVVALQGPLLSDFGDDEAPGEGRSLRVSMEHATCFLAGGLIQMDSGPTSRFLLPLNMTVRNNIFSANSQTPLITLSGRTTTETDFRKLIRWEGVRNFYDKFASYWAVGSGSTATASNPLPFDDWKHLLGDNEVEANNNGIAWKNSWQSKPLATIRSTDFVLANLNQAINGGTDGDAGADLSGIRPMPETTTP